MRRSETCVWETMEQTSKIIFPLKYKLLLVLLGLLLGSLSLFFTLAYRSFSQDKRLFLMDANQTLLRAVVAEIKLDLQARLDLLQVFVPRVSSNGHSSSFRDPFQNLPPYFADELLGVRVYSASKAGIVLKSAYSNPQALGKLHLEPSTFFQSLDAAHSPASAIQDVIRDKNFELLNRSYQAHTLQKETRDVGILSFAIPGNFVNSTQLDLVLIIDYNADFLRSRLNNTDEAEIFLIEKNGSLLADAHLGKMLAFANQKMPHPVQKLLAVPQPLPRQSFEGTLGGVDYLCQLASTDFPNTYAVAQVRKEDAFMALRQLAKTTILFGALLLSGSAFICILFASRFTQSIATLRLAAEAIGKGDLNIHVKVRGHDEMRSVGESFNWMARRIQTLISESVEKSRMEEELKTAKIIQDTLLTISAPKDSHIRVEHFYEGASECGGDFWDWHVHQNIATLLIGDATGHGAPAAIVTATVKSCLLTLQSVYGLLRSDQYMYQLNNTLYEACKSRLMMTLCLVQIDLSSGQMRLVNAGHEVPFVLRAGKTGPEALEDLPGRGERLGDQPHTLYSMQKYQLQLGDTVCLYTDGITDLQNTTGKSLGERKLKKAFIKQAGSAVSLAQAKQHLVDQMKLHRGNAPLKDDVTFLLFQWTKRFEQKEQPASQPHEVSVAA